MGFYRRILKWKSRIYDNFLINPKVVKISIISGLATFFTSIIIGYIVAQFDPDGYNMIKNWVSDMGSFNHTPLPYFLDYGAMITSILLIPSIFYMEKRLAPPPDPNEFPRMKYRLSSLGFFCMLVGYFGFFMIGLFSEDRTTSLGLHFLFSLVVFGGLVWTSVFYGLLVLFYKTEIPRYFGIYMIIFPFTTGILIIINFSPLFEWILLFSLLIWLVPVNIILLRNINKE